MICECGNHAWAPLTRGHITLVDPEDVGYLKQKWSSLSEDYPYAFSRFGLLHREIVSAKCTELVDHRNGWCGDNRKHNLRTATRTQNAQNTKRHSDNRSGVKGVYWHAGLKKWRACINLSGKRTSLGVFIDKSDAARAYDAAAAKHFGNFAKTNDTLDRVGATQREAAE